MENRVRLKIYFRPELFKFERRKRLPLTKFFRFFETRLTEDVEPFTVRNRLQLLNDFLSRIVTEPESSMSADQATAEKNRNRNLVPIENVFQRIVTTMPIIQGDNQRFSWQFTEMSVLSCLDEIRQRHNVIDLLEQA